MLYFIAVLCAASLVVSTSTNDELRLLFDTKIDSCGAFYLEHGYTPPAKDDQSTLQLFITAYHAINQHNSNPDRKYSQVLNCFATVKDTHHSLLLMTTPKVNRTVGPDKLTVGSNSGTSPVSYDRRNDDTSTSVKDQTNFGSCGPWAFSAIAALESKYLDLTGDNLADADFSEQQFLDCTYEAEGYTDGCDGAGGWMFDAWDRLEDQEMGILYNEEQRPYSINISSYNDRVCNILELNKPNAMKKVVMKKPSYGWDDDSYYSDSPYPMGAVTQDRLWLHGAISIAIRVESAFDYYYSGVFDSYCNSSGVNHAVTLVGYSQYTFTAKNSWGTDWGEAGYIRLSRTNGNLCQYLSYTMWPLMECAWGMDSITGKCVDKEPCSCQNNQKCILKQIKYNGYDDWYCECKGYWYGEHCDNGNCFNGICQNSGSCNDMGVCECSYEWMGDYCTEENPCAEIECLNGGKCDPTTGECSDPCAEIDCPRGGKCDPTTGECSDGMDETLILVVIILAVISVGMCALIPFCTCFWCWWKDRARQPVAPLPETVSAQPQAYNREPTIMTTNGYQVEYIPQPEGWYEAPPPPPVVVAPPAFAHQPDVKLA